MLVWGSNNKVIAGQLIEGIDCPSCESNQFNSFGLMRYFHLYKIPTCVTSQKVGIECTHCKKTLVGNELPNDLATQLKKAVFTKKNTLPMFGGLALAIVAVIAIAFGIYQDNQQEAAYIAAPQVHDYYIIDVRDVFDDTESPYRYGLMRIAKVAPEAVIFQIGDTVYNKSKGLRKDISSGAASQDSYYSGYAEFTQAELTRLHDNGGIQSIERR